MTMPHSLHRRLLAIEERAARSAAESKRISADEAERALFWPIEQLRANLIRDALHGAAEFRGERSELRADLVKPARWYVELVQLPENCDDDARTRFISKVQEWIDYELDAGFTVYVREDRWLVLDW